MLESFALAAKFESPQVGQGNRSQLARFVQKGLNDATILTPALVASIWIDHHPLLCGYPKKELAIGLLD